MTEPLAPPLENLNSLITWDNLILVKREKNITIHQFDGYIGWWVRLYFPGIRCPHCKRAWSRMVHRHFSFKKYGGKTKAFIAAKAWKDKMNGAT